MTQDNLGFAAATRRAIAVLRNFSFSNETRAFPTNPLVPAARSRAAILSVAVTFVFLGLLAGCHSSFVQTTIVNRSGAPLRLVELDYPSASLGTTNLNNGGEYHYRFKIQGSGTVKLDFVDSTGKAHHAVGPELDEGQEGTLLVTIDESNNVSWKPSFPVNK